MAVFGFFERERKQWKEFTRDTVKRGQPYYLVRVGYSSQHNKLQLTLTTEARHILKRPLQNCIHKFIRINCVLVIKEFYFWNLIRNYLLIYDLYTYLYILFACIFELEYVTVLFSMFVFPRLPSSKENIKLSK